MCRYYSKRKFSSIDEIAFGVFGLFVHQSNHPYYLQKEFYTSMASKLTNKCPVICEDDLILLT